jgi:hypothetical protein
MHEGKVTRTVLISSTTLGHSTSGMKPSKERSKIFLDGPRVVVFGFFASKGAREVATDIAGVEGQGAGAPEASVSMACSSRIFSTVILGKACANVTIASGVRSNAKLWGLIGGLGVEFIACAKVHFPVIGAVMWTFFGALGALGGVGQYFIRGCRFGGTGFR